MSVSVVVLTAGMCQQLLVTCTVLCVIFYEYFVLQVAANIPVE